MRATNGKKANNNKKLVKPHLFVCPPLCYVKNSVVTVRDYLHHYIYLLRSTETRTKTIQSQ